jgi:hypothetical protein
MPVYDDMDIKEYHSHEGLSSTKLRALLVDVPSTALYRLNNPTESKAMDTGTLLHMALLEPDKFESQYVVKPEGMTFRSNESKAWRDEHLQAGRSIVTAEEIAYIKEIHKHVNANPEYEAFRKMKSMGKPEVSLIWDEVVSPEGQGWAWKTKLKARPDWLWEKHGVIFDLKTTSKKNFRKSVEDLHYLLQAYLQIRGYEVLYKKPCKGFVWVVLEAFPPYNIQYVSIDTTDREPYTSDYWMGKRLFEVSISKWRKCTIENNWPGYGGNVTPLKLSRYYINQVLEM